MSHVVKQGLSIYLTQDCPACGTAQSVAAEVTRARPDIQVKMIYLDNGEIPPPAVFGVPTYLWRGRVISLGNPHVEELLSLLDDSPEEGISL